jgi:hypothetical protein
MVVSVCLVVSLFAYLMPVFLPVFLVVCSPIFSLCCTRFHFTTSLLSSSLVPHSLD